MVGLIEQPKQHNNPAVNLEHSEKLLELNGQIQETRFTLREDSKYFASMKERIDSMYSTPVNVELQHNIIKVNFKGIETDKSTESELKSKQAAIGVTGASASRSEALGLVKSAEIHLKDSASQIELANELLDSGKLGEAEAVVGNARDLEHKAKQEALRAEKVLEIAQKQIEAELQSMAAQKEIDNQVIIDMKDAFSASNSHTAQKQKGNKDKVA